MDKRYLGRLSSVTLLCLLPLLVACQPPIILKLPTKFKDASSMEKVSAKVGVYFSPAFTSHKHVFKIGDTTIVYPIGESSRSLLISVLSAIFEDVEEVASRPPFRPGGKQLSAVIEPFIELFRTDKIWGSRPVRTEIRYGFRLYAPDGSIIAKWAVDNAIDFSPKPPIEIENYATGASYVIREAAWKFLQSFQSEPVVQAWLSRTTKVSWTPPERKEFPAAFKIVLGSATQNQQGADQGKQNPGTFSGIPIAEGGAGLPDSGAMPFKGANFTVEIRADPYSQVERQERYLEADLKAAGVLPVHVIIRNLGEDKLKVSPRMFTLDLPTGPTVRAGYVGDVMVRPWRGEKISNLRSQRLAAGIVSGLFLGIGILPGLVEDYHKREEAYRAAVLSEKVLDKGETAKGFLFFVIPRGVPLFSSATLRAKIPGARSASPREISLPMELSTSYGGGTIQEAENIVPPCATVDAQGEIESPNSACTVRLDFRITKSPSILAKMRVVGRFNPASKIEFNVFALENEEGGYRKIDGKIDGWVIRLETAQDSSRFVVCDGLQCERGKMLDQAPIHIKFQKEAIYAINIVVDRTQLEESKKHPNHVWAWVENVTWPMEPSGDFESSRKGILAGHKEGNLVGLSFSNAIVTHVVFSAY